MKKRLALCRSPLFDFYQCALHLIKMSSSIIVKRTSPLVFIRWLLILPAYFLGLALPPGILILYIMIFKPSWSYQSPFYPNGFYFLVGFLSSFGGAAFPAFAAPRHKQLTALVCCILTAIAFYFFFQLETDDEAFTKNLRSLGYLLGGLLAFFFILVANRNNKRRKRGRAPAALNSASILPSCHPKPSVNGVQTKKRTDERQ